MQTEKELLNTALALIKKEKHKKAADLLIASGLETPLVLFQTAISLLWLQDYDKAEAVLKKYIAKNPEPDALDMLLTVYIKKADEENAALISEQILIKNPDNDRALVYYCAFFGPRRLDVLNNSLTLLKYAERFIGPGKRPAGYQVSILISALTNCCRAAVHMGYIDTFFACLDEIRAILPPEHRDFPLYKSIIGSAQGTVVYTNYYPDDKIIDIMHEMYNLNKPPYINSFERDTSLYREIRIAFLSSDLRFHPTGRFITALFANTNPNARIAYYCYDTNNEPCEGEITDALKKSSREYKYIGDLSDDEIEAVILKDEPDILFELNGVGQKNKCHIAVRRLAPVQFNYIGFPCSCGTQNIDYIITDPVTDPPEYAARFYTETPVYMQKTFLCYPTIFYDDSSFPICRPPFEKNGYITFGTFNKLQKYTPEILAAWAEILNRLPDARIKVVCSTATDEASHYALNKKFNDAGIDMSRIDFTEPTVYHKYMYMYDEVDIILDTFPFNGATTTCDAFYMGVPVITLTGIKHWERVGLAMLKHVGLEDLAAYTTEDYIKAAVTLANDKQRLIHLKRTLRDTFAASALADTAGFKTEYENLMRRVYIKYCAENRQRPAKKTEKELFREIVCGLSFFADLIPDTMFSPYITRARDELISLQLRFIRTLDNSENTANYKKAVSIINSAADIDEIKRICDICLDLLVICTEGRDYR